MVNNIQQQAKQLNLSYPNGFANAEAKELKSICNGCGAEWMPTWSRWFLDSVMNLECTTAIHDYRYHYSDGMLCSQRKYDLEFFANGHIEIYSKYRWFSVYRYWSIFKLTFAYKALQKYGNIAYKNTKRSDMQCRV